MKLNNMDNKQLNENNGCGAISLIIFGLFLILIILDISVVNIPFYVYIATLIIMFIAIKFETPDLAKNNTLNTNSNSLDITQLFSAGKYLTGYHANDKPEDHLNFYLTEEYLRVYNFKKNIFFSIRLADITNITLEDKTTIESRVGLKRLMVTGIFAFALKKKVKTEIHYLVIEYKRDDFRNDIYFEYEGKGKLQYATKAKNKIQTAVLEYRKKPVIKSDIPETIKEEKLHDNKDEYSFDLTGVHIQNRKKYIENNCDVGDEIKLYPEPNNEYDPNAIIVRHNNKIIGYVPADETKYVKDIITNNYDAIIIAIDNFDGYLDVTINITSK